MLRDGAVKRDGGRDRGRGRGCGRTVAEGATWRVVGVEVGAAQTASRQTGGVSGW